MQFRHIHFPRADLSDYFDKPTRFAWGVIAALIALAFSLGAIVLL